MTRRGVLILVVAACTLVGACQTGGSDEAELSLAMPSDTYETCAGGGELTGGASFLSSGGDNGGGSVRLGMTECALIGALGQPDQVAPGVRPDQITPGIQPVARRVVTMTYRNPDGTGTAYVFVNNAMKEINRVQEGSAAAVN